MGLYLISHMQECLFVLVCDDFEEVSEAAQVFLGDLFSSRGKHDIKHDVAQIFSRFNYISSSYSNVVLALAILFPNCNENLERSGYLEIKLHISAFLFTGSPRSFQMWCLEVRRQLQYHMLKNC